MYTVQFSIKLVTKVINAYLEMETQSLNQTQAATQYEKGTILFQQTIA